MHQCLAVPEIFDGSGSGSGTVFRYWTVPVPVLVPFFETKRFRFRFFCFGDSVPGPVPEPGFPPNTVPEFAPVVTMGPTAAFVLKHNQ